MSSLRLHSQSFLQPCRTTTSKHYNPKFKKERAAKYLKVDLPNTNESFEDMPPEKLRQKMKERGVLPPRPWMERPFYISATGKQLRCQIKYFKLHESYIKYCINIFSLFIQVFVSSGKLTSVIEIK